MSKIREFDEPTKEELEAASLYGGLMGEGLMRIFAIDHGTTNKSGLESPFVQEFCYLQLRKLCELVAIACLVAHGDIKEASSLRGEWNADKIIKRLSELEANFFPYAVEMDLSPASGPKGLIGRPGGMTKEEMLSIYYQTYQYMHVGKLKNLLKPKNPLRVNYPDITAKAQKFRTLIESHTVFISAGRKALICYLQGEKTIQVAIGDRMNEGPPQLVR